MLKKNKGMLLLTSVIILLPIAVGLLLWNELPEMIATHFGVDNEPNGWSSKGFAVFGLPCVLLGIHWIAVLATAMDSRSRNIHGRMMTLLFWICPAVSLVCNALTYTYALGLKPDVGLTVMLLLGILYIVLGNYLPKCGQNYSLGIRLPWTLNDPENWRRTHRVAGWSLTVGGVLILASAPFRIPWLFIIIVFLSILLPVAYSCAYARRHR